MRALISLPCALFLLFCSVLCCAETPDVTAGETPALPWVERYLKALEVDPDNAALRYQLGLSLLSVGEDAAAIKEMHRAYPSLSQTIGINFNLGLAYTRLRDPESGSYIQVEHVIEGLDIHIQKSLRAIATGVIDENAQVLDGGDSFGERVVGNIGRPGQDTA